jgi:histone H3/H4
MARSKVVAVAEKKKDAPEIKKTAGKKVAGKKAPAAAAVERDSLAIPKAVGRRFLRRSGCERVSGELQDTLNEIAQRKALEVISSALRMAQLDGRCTIKTRDVSRALSISNIRIY